MTIDVEVIREFRLLLRDYFDAQFEDWGDEANEPRFRLIEQFLGEHTDAHDELAELFLFSFFNLDDGLCSALRRLGRRLGPAGLSQEIDEYGERRPREVRTGYVRRMQESLRSSLERSD